MCLTQAGQWKGNKGGVSDMGLLSGRETKAVCLMRAAKWKDNKGSVSDTGRSVEVKQRQCV